MQATRAREPCETFPCHVSPPCRCVEAIAFTALPAVLTVQHMLMAGDYEGHESQVIPQGFMLASKLLKARGRCSIGTRPSTVPWAAAVATVLLQALQAGLVSAALRGMPRLLCNPGLAGRLAGWLVCLLAHVYW